MIQTYEPNVVNELPAVTWVDAEEADAEAVLSRGGDEVYTLKPLASRRMTVCIIETQTAPFHFVDEGVPAAVREE